MKVGEVFRNDAVAAGYLASPTCRCVTWWRAAASGADAVEQQVPQLVGGVVAVATE